MRNPGKILQIFKREINTNQRIYFDVSSDSRFMSSGNNDGTVNIWELNADDSSENEQSVFNSFKAHTDCVNGVRFD